MTLPSPIFVLDLETIPDLARLHAASPTDPPSEDATAPEPSPPARMPKPAFHQIVAIAGAWIAPNGMLRQLRALGDPSWSEAALIEEAFRIISVGHPRLVGWNSQGFDLPVLVYRAMVHGVAAPQFYLWGEPYHGYRKRFDEDNHLDLMDVLSFYGSSPRMSLHEMARVLGIPGKLDMDGSQVWDRYQAGEIEAIREYCTADVLTTALVFGRYAYHRGWWTADHITTWENSVAAWLDAQSAPLWDRFRDQWQPVTQVIGRAPWDDSPSA
ncbi:3'-5' exonuclease [Sulfobacillus thermosulfidooxidans]|uniref:3'-5' exonuclease n=1 Tax=Sulfobacillus thermosulfidooxidans TaxID=28034 RepID=UPI0006B4E19F|nr:3'-5' exonuclease [Sulfobacillus thermosulfidooxidans]